MHHLAGHRLIKVLKIITQAMTLRLLVMTRSSTSKTGIISLSRWLALASNLEKKKKGYTTVQKQTALHRQGAYIINASQELITYSHIWNRFNLFYLSPIIIHFVFP